MSNRADNCNRANSNVTPNPPSDGGANWLVKCGGTDVFGIDTNQIKWVSAGGPAAVPGIALEAGSAVVTLKCTFTVVGGDAGVMLRHHGTNDNSVELFYRSGGGHNLYRVVAGAYTSIATGSNSPANGDIVTVTVDASNSYSALVNGAALLGPVTEASGSANTKHGLVSNSDVAVRYDDISITDNAPAGIALMGQACL